MTVFKCPNIKCAYAIASEGLNAVKLKVLRRTAKACPKCGQLAVFLEQASLPNIQTKTTSLMEGQDNANTSSANTPRTAAKLKAAREAKH